MTDVLSLVMLGCALIAALAFGVFSGLPPSLLRVLSDAASLPSRRQSQAGDGSQPALKPLRTKSSENSI